MQGDEPPARSARRALEEAEELAVAGDGLVEDADLEAAEAAFRAALDKALVALGPGGDDSRATSVADSAITPRLYRALGKSASWQDGMRPRFTGSSRPVILTRGMNARWPSR